MSNLQRFVIIIAMVTIINGCGTVISQHMGHKGKTFYETKEEYEKETCGIGQPSMFSGVAFDTRALLAPFACKGGGEGGLAYIAMYPIILPLCIIDLPLSLAADIIILPYSTYRQIKYGNMAEHKVREE